MIRLRVRVEHDTLSNPYHVFAHLHLDDPHMHDIPIYQVNRDYDVHILYQFFILNHL